MTGATTLSVIVPVHDAAEHLPVMLRSLRAGAGPDVQVIAVDDASTDATPELLARADLPRLDVVRTETAVGAASARNLGLDRVEGRLVTFLDGDDWIAPGHLATLVEAIDSLGCDMVRTDHVQVRGRERTLHRAPGRRNIVLDPRGSILPVHRETMVDYPFSWAGVYRASLGDLLRFEDGLHTATDRPWVWRLHREVPSFATVSHAGVFYRREVAGSLTTIGDERRLHVFDAYDHVFAQVRDEPDLRPKAVRQFLGLVARHVTMAELYEPGLRARFDQRARAALAALDPREVAEVLPRDDRRALLAPLLPAGVGA